MAAKSFSEEKLILSMFCGIWKSRCLSVLVSLGVPELLCNSSSPVSIQEVTERTGCRTDENIYKVMRTMAQWGIGEELSEKSFRANRAMELLRRDKGPSLGHMVGYYGSDEIWTAMLALPDAIKHGGDTAFEIAHGMNPYDYMFKVEGLEYSANETKPRNVASEMGTKERRREFAANYERAMNMVTQLDLQDAQPSVFTVYPWDKCNQIMDIGGGEGQFLSSILKLSGCENTHGILFEFPDVIKHAKVFLAKEGIAESRVTLISGDMLEDVPLSKEVDTIIAKNLFVMFTEDEMIKVLENCRRVLANDGKFIIVNSCNPEAGDTNHNVTKTGLHPAFRSIHTMSLYKMGTFRTKSEWLHLIGRLCTRVAFQLRQVYETGDGPTLFEMLKCE